MYVYYSIPHDSVYLGNSWQWVSVNTKLIFVSWWKTGNGF
jgi:hypothetical protein